MESKSTKLVLADVKFFNADVSILSQVTAEVGKFVCFLQREVVNCGVRRVFTLDMHYFGLGFAEL